MVRILFIGDIVGRPGRELVRRGLGPLCDYHQVDLVIAKRTYRGHGNAWQPAHITVDGDDGPGRLRYALSRALDEIPVPAPPAETAAGTVVRPPSRACWMSNESVATPCASVRTKASSSEEAQLSMTSQFSVEATRVAVWPALRSPWK